MRLKDWESQATGTTRALELFVVTILVDRFHDPFAREHAEHEQENHQAEADGQKLGIHTQN